MDKKPDKIKREESLSTKSKNKTPAFILTHPDKILYPEDQFSKRDIYQYYESISTYILPFIKNRPLTLLRCPNHYKECFFQKHLNQKQLQGLAEISIQEKNKESKDYIYVRDEKGLLSLIQMGVLEIHPWSSTIKQLEYPDILIFDLDPAPDVAWKAVVQAALELKAIFDQLKLSAFVKTTGGKGLHVVVPIKAQHSWEVIKEYTHVFVTTLEESHPSQYISKMTKAKRQGKIFVDYLRNQRGATAIAPYSTRARIHAPVATPIHWDELTACFEDTYYTIKTLPQRLARLKSDPWEKFWTKQSLKLA